MNGSLFYKLESELSHLQKIGAIECIKINVTQIAGRLMTHISPRPDAVERASKWNFDRRTKQIKDNGGASGWWDDMPDDVKDSHRKWIRELLTVALMDKP